MTSGLRDTVDSPPLYYDKQGRPISLKSWVEKFEDLEYRLVAQHDFEGGYRVVTMWMGTDSSLSCMHGGKPVIFGTAVFNDGEMSDQFQEMETSTEQDALMMHNLRVKNVEEKLTRLEKLEELSQCPEKQS